MQSPATSPAGYVPRKSALLAFLIGPPILLSLPQGWNQMGPGLALAPSLEWWALSWSLFWWLSELFSRATARCLRPWVPPVSLVMALGALASALASRWWHPWLFGVLRPALQPEDPGNYWSTARDLADPAYLTALLKVSIPGITFWVLGNLLFDRATGTSRFKSIADTAPGDTPVDPPIVSAMTPTATGLEPAEVAVADTAPRAPPAQHPRFLSRMVRFANAHESTVLAVEAEDHYVKVHTLGGSELIYYRFADAIADLAGCDGLQVHRSFWVRRSAISELQTRGRQGRLVLTNGLQIPVSQSNLGLLRQIKHPSLAATTRSGR